MERKQLFWIIPLTIVISSIIAFIWGASVSWNIVAEKCNTGMEITGALNKLECQLSETAMNMWEYYENRCPDIYLEIQSNNFDIYDEWKKYGINNSDVADIE